MYKFLVIIFILFIWFLPDILFAKPFFSKNHTFPVAHQWQNACYFNSINIALEAKFGTKIRINKALQMIGFTWKSLATWEYKKKFSDLTHVIILEYKSKKDLIRLLDIGEPVLVSTEIKLKSWKSVRHVSVAYSYDDVGIWVSDPLGGIKKQLLWSDVFYKNGWVKYYNLRTISIKPYEKWSLKSKEREKNEDIWINESKLD